MACTAGTPASRENVESYLWADAILALYATKPTAAVEVTDAMVQAACEALTRFGDSEVPRHWAVVGDDPNGAMKAALLAALSAKASPAAHTVQLCAGDRKDADCIDGVYCDCICHHEAPAATPATNTEVCSSTVEQPTLNRCAPDAEAREEASAGGSTPPHLQAPAASPATREYPCADVPVGREFAAGEALAVPGTWLKISCPGDAGTGHFFMAFVKSGEQVPTFCNECMGGIEAPVTPIIGEPIFIENCNEATPCGECPTCVQQQIDAMGDCEAPAATPATTLGFGCPHGGYLIENGCRECEDEYEADSTPASERCAYVHQFWGGNVCDEPRNAEVHWASNTPHRHAFVATPAASEAPADDLHDCDEGFTCCDGCRHVGHVRDLPTDHARELTPEEAGQRIKPDIDLPTIMAYHNVFGEKVAKDEPRAEVSVSCYLCTTEQAAAANDAVECAIRLKREPTITREQFYKAVDIILNQIAWGVITVNDMERALAAAGITVLE